MDIYDEVRHFFENKQTLDDFFESKAIIWVDWREYDEDVIHYFNATMEQQVEVRLVDNGKPYGDDLLLKNEEKQVQIPYKGEMDRDTTIQCLNAFIQPRYEIRLFVESLGSDTLGFVLLQSDEWATLEKTFGKDTVGYYFVSICFERKMFDLDVNEVFFLMELRSKNENTDFAILMEWAAISAREKHLITQKETGQISLASYLQEKKMIKKLKDAFIKSHEGIRL